MKKGNDEAKVAAASKVFSELKKNVKKVVKSRFTQLFADFLSGDEQEAEKWTAAYLSNPVLRSTASLIVWQQGKNTFTYNWAAILFGRAVN